MNAWKPRAVNQSATCLPLQIRRQPDIGAAREHHHRGAVIMPRLRRKNRQCGSVFARVSLGLGRIARPQANRPDAEERVVFARLWSRAPFAAAADTEASRHTTAMLQKRFTVPSILMARIIANQRSTIDDRSRCARSGLTGSRPAGSKWAGGLVAALRLRRSGSLRQSDVLVRRPGT